MRGAESASDGTTVLSMRDGIIVCSGAATPSAAKTWRCIEANIEGTLAARPLLGGRALVARRGPSNHDLALQIIGEQSPVPNVRVNGHLLEIETTSEGFVRLWTHPREHFWRVAKGKGIDAVEAFIVMSDGSLRPDLALRQLRDEVAGSQTPSR